MKKILSIFALSFMIPLCLLLTACGTQHYPSRYWHMDESKHWRMCACGGNCTKIFNSGAHEFIDTTDKDTKPTPSTKGRDYKRCRICGYETYTEIDYQHTHTFINGICSCGEVESTFVKEIDWNNLFVGDYLNNVTLEQNMYLYNNSNPNTPIKSETTRYSLCSENAVMIRTSSNNEKTTVYHVKQDNSWFAVAMTNNQWYGINETESEAKAASFQVAEGVNFVGLYNGFSYTNDNKNKKCFYKTNMNIAGETCEYVRIYVNNGKLVKIERKVKLSNGTQYALNIIEFSNHGTTIVNPPAFTLAG